MTTKKERKYPHFKKCQCGNGGETLSKGHEWYIHAPNYYNCFWTYLRHNTRTHTLSEVADLIGVSISAITAIERRAVRKLKKRLKRQFKGEKII